MAELDRRATGTTLLSTGAHPGYAATHLQRGQGQPAVEFLMGLGNRLIAQSDAQGAWPQLYAGTMPDVQGGEYFGPSLLEIRGHPKRVGRTRKAQDRAAAARLWEVSEELTKVSYDALA